ncbi:MAG TPA: hypothetical protein VKR27_04890 [Acidimicrobiales bacterium]|nr:hypothetical protein [Acidimicrobiales bacterium]
MSVIVIIKVPGDTAKARATFDSNGDVMKGISQRGKAAGAHHHKFGEGDGEIIVVDEWESREAFEGFFGDPEIAAFMAEAGASGQPSVEFYEVIETADAF